MSQQLIFTTRPWSCRKIMFVLMFVCSQGYDVTFCLWSHVLLGVWCHFLSGPMFLQGGVWSIPWSIPVGSGSSWGGVLSGGPTLSGRRPPRRETLWRETLEGDPRYWHIVAPTNSPIHKAAGSLVTGRSLQNGKMSMGNRRTERPPDPILYGGRPSGGFVNRAAKRAVRILLECILVKTNF